jgi:hypothetical protein
METRAEFMEHWSDRDPAEARERLNVLGAIEDKDGAEWAEHDALATLVAEHEDNDERVFEILEEE